MTEELGEFHVFPNSNGGVDHERGGKGGHARNGMVDLGIDLAQQGLGYIGGCKGGGIERPDQ
jgi:hypothetical protein